MNEDSKSYDAKIVLLGTSGVGKTSLGLRYVNQTFETEQQSTMVTLAANCVVKLQIWDTAGQERGASAAILVFDITSVESFDNVKGWVKELRENVHADIVIGIAGNKVDLEPHRQVRLEKAKEYADSIGAMLFETSAKENVGVDELFVELTRRLLQRHEQKQIPVKANDTVQMNERRKDRNCC